MLIFALLGPVLGLVAFFSQGDETTPVRSVLGAMTLPELLRLVYWAYLVGVIPAALTGLVVAYGRRFFPQVGMSSRLLRVGLATGLGAGISAGLGVVVLGADSTMAFVGAIAALACMGLVEWRAAQPTGSAQRVVQFRRIALWSLVAVLVGGVVWSMQWPARTGWESASIGLDSQSSIVISRKRAHPFLAEYARQVSVVRSGEQLATLDYPEDTGGGFPMQVRFYVDGTQRLVRLTDRLYDRLIDLHTGQFTGDQTHSIGKEMVSFVRESDLPPLQRHFVIGSRMEVISR